jgi:hypothetical protein
MPNQYDIAMWCPLTVVANGQYQVCTLVHPDAPHDSLYSARAEHLGLPNFDSRHGTKLLVCVLTALGCLAMTQMTISRSGTAVTYAQTTRCTSDTKQSESNAQTDHSKQCFIPSRPKEAEQSFGYMEVSFAAVRLLTSCVLSLVAIDLGL